MNVGVVSIGVETSIEDERRVHKRAGVDKTTSLTDLHLLNIENETAVKDLKSHRTLAAKY